MIIDFRNRPPYGAFKKSFLFTEEAVKRYCSKFDVEHTEAVKQLSMELYEKEKEEAGITSVVIQGTKAQNKDIQELIDRYPGEYFGFAMIDLKDNEAESEAIIDQYVVEGNMSGVSMIPSFAGLLVDDENLFPIYEKCNEIGCPVMVFSGGNSLINYKENEPIHIDNVAKTFPELKIIVGHACWPFVQEMCGVAYKRENVYLCPDLYMFRSAGYQDFATAASWHLRDRFLFATSYPQVPMNMMVDWYRSCGIREGVLDNIFYENAARLLRITENA